MLITIKSKNLEVGDRLKSYIEKKVDKLDRFLPNIDEARVELSTQQTKSTEDRQVVQITLRVNSSVMRAEERSSDLQTSLDAALEKITRQITRYKGKHWRSLGRPQLEKAEVEAETLAEERELGPELGSEVVRIKRFQTQPMDVDEAIEQMELLGHDFFAFYNIASNSFSVVYRRRDGGYGLLIPELA